MSRRIWLEGLEERIAPAVIAAGDSLLHTDGDGDTIEISYFGPDGSTA